MFHHRNSSMASISQFVEKIKLIDIEMDLRDIGWGGMEWIDLAPDRDQWRAFMNMVIKF
jgi:hypothetical protein